MPRGWAWFLVNAPAAEKKLLGITKRGDVCLRTLLIYGALGAAAPEARTDHEEGSLAQLIKRRHSNVAAVALANKNARIVWALLTHGREYQAGYVSARASAAS
jgi:transposase